MTSRRSGGRKARQVLRAAPFSKAQQPVKAGTASGAYQPLSQHDMAMLNDAILDLLEQVGLSQATPSCIEQVCAAGGIVKNGRLSFPRALVEDTIANAARDITLYGQDPQHDLHLTGSKVYFGTAGAAVHIVDDWKPGPDGQCSPYRESSALDLYDASRLVDHLDHIHFFQRCMVARDIEDPRVMDLNTTYASISGTQKHCGLAYVDPIHAEESLRMLHEIAGSEAAWHARPFASLSCCFVVPPMRFAQDACRVMEVCIRGGMPILLLSAGQAGATSPASLSGTIVQEWAEVLAGLVYANAVVAKHPCIAGPWPFVSDLRTGSMTGGSGEQAAVAAACGQMGRFYDLPTGIAAGMTDSKNTDAQSGYEKGYTPPWPRIVVPI